MMVAGATGVRQGLEMAGFPGGSSSRPTACLVLVQGLGRRRAARKLWAESASNRQKCDPGVACPLPSVPSLRATTSTANMAVTHTMRSAEPTPSFQQASSPQQMVRSTH